MKASTRSSLSTCAMLGFSLLLAPSAARANLVFGTQCKLSPPPQCDDGLDNDGDRAVDYDGNPLVPLIPDPQCEASLDGVYGARFDDGEATAGFQGPPQELICHTTIVHLEHPQGFPLPEPFACPECYWIELVDFRVLLDAPISQILKSLSGNLKVSSPLTLTTPVPDVFDDPNIPNLKLQYVGKSEILGPAVVGEITLWEPFAFPAGLKYVGQAFDTQAGRVVTNTGTLTATPAAPPGGDSLFDAKLSYSNWNPGGRIGSLKGFDVELCPPWWPWPWPWPGRPRFDLRISSYEIDKVGFSRVIPLELGLLLPFPSASRVIPYVGAGLGYYRIKGDFAAAQDEMGGYGALGMDIHIGDLWGLSFEGAYREVGGSLGFSGPVFEAGIGFNF